MKQVSCKAIVLSRIDYGEADRILTFLTPEKGKIRAIAKGVRKPKNRLAGGIELFCQSDITYIEGKSNLHTLISSRMDINYPSIIKDIDKTMFGYEMLKVLNKVLEDDAGQEFYHLLTDSLSSLNIQTIGKNMIECSFLLKLMSLLGHVPNFVTDTSGANLSENELYNFSVEDMSFYTNQNGSYKADHIKVLRLLVNNSPSKLVSIVGINNLIEDLIQLVRQMSRQYAVTFN